MTAAKTLSAAILDHNEEKTLPKRAKKGVEMEDIDY